MDANTIFNSIDAAAYAKDLDGNYTYANAAVIETPEAMESYLLRAQGQDDAKRRAQRCIEAVQEAAELGVQRGWLLPG